MYFYSIKWYNFVEFLNIYAKKDEEKKRTT
jgi:hypothetical protein